MKDEKQLIFRSHLAIQWKGGFIKMALTKDKDNFSVSKLISEKKAKQRGFSLTEKIMPIILYITALISVLTTVGIVFTLIFETITFFKTVSIVEFFTEKEWQPFFEESATYGIAPLIAGTLLVAFIAMVVAIPIGSL